MLQVPIDALKAYRSRLLAQGRALEARAVARCIQLLRKEAKAP